MCEELRKRIVMKIDGGENQFFFDSKPIEDWKPTSIPFAKARKRIETLFSQLTDQFLIIRNYAKITNGLFAKIIGKISALIILQYVNFINNKPMCRIKYALN